MAITNGLSPDGVYYQWFRSERQEWSSPLVMIMGYGGNLATFTNEFLLALSAHGDVITFDHLGSGKSHPIERGREVSFVEFADHVARLVEHLGLSRINLLGYSMGGCIALEYMNKYGTNVDRLILQSTTAGGKYYHKADPEVAERMQNPRGSTFDEMYFDFLSISMPQRAIDENRVLLQQICDITREPATPVHVLQMKLRAFRNFDGCAYLEKIGCPALVIHGKDDQLLRVGNGQDIAAHLPTAKLFLLDDCGHYPHIEYRDRVVDAITSFLAAK